MSLEFKVFSNHVKLEGISFFRGNASSVRLASWGELKQPLTQQNYLLVEGNVPAKKLDVRRAVTLTLAQDKLTEQDVGASVNVAGIGKIDGGLVAEQLRQDKLKLVKFEILPKNIVDVANASPQVIEGLKRVGNDGRLVHQVLVAMEAKMATTFSTAGSLDAQVSAGIFKITAGGGAGSSGSVTVEMSDCTFAYLLLKPKWDANQKKNWTRIVDWDDDKWGLN